MTSFCVFGVSKQLCRQKAERKIPTFIMKERKRIDLTPVEWGALVAKAAAELFDTIDKQAKISPAFDAPQFCHDWLRVSPSEVRLTKIMVRKPKLDERGKPIMRKGAPVLSWHEYAG